jgi:hypothetical protein
LNTTQFFFKYYASKYKRNRGKKVKAIKIIKCFI